MCTHKEQLYHQPASSILRFIRKPSRRVGGLVSHTDNLGITFTVVIVAAVFLNCLQQLSG